MLISEKDTHFEVCPFSQTSIKLRASHTADKTVQRKHLALHMRDTASIRHSRNRATEGQMGKKPQSCTKTPLSLVFKGENSFEKRPSGLQIQWWLLAELLSVFSKGKQDEQIIS